MALSLQEVLVVGSFAEQVKFSELTLDMFRMLQTLEREPQEDLAQIYDASPAPGSRAPFVSFFISEIFACEGVGSRRRQFSVFILFFFCRSHFFFFLMSILGAITPAFV